VLTRKEFYETQLYSIRAAQESDGIRWIEGLGYELATDGLVLDTPDFQKLLGRDKGKAAYKGSHNTGRNGKPYLSLTVINHAYGGSKEIYDGSKAVVDALWDEYRGNPTSQKTRKASEKKLKAKTIERDAKIKAKADKDAAEKKKARMKAIRKFHNELSTTSSDNNSDGYLRKKRILELIPAGLIKYGRDFFGGYAATLLFLASTLSYIPSNRKPTGFQKFYSEKISGNDKRHEKGTGKQGACVILGSLEKGYDGLILVFEGFADGVVAHYRKKVPCLVAMDVGNMLGIAKAVKEQFPKATVGIVGDNDAHKYKLVEQDGKTKDGYDNAGIIKGIEAAMAVDGVYFVPNFKGLDQSGKPKDLWDLWDLGGDEAVDKLLSNPQSPPSQDEWETLKLNYLGAKSFLKMLEGKSIDDALELARPHLDRLGLDEKDVVDHVNQAAQKSAKHAQPAVLSIGGDGCAHISRLAKADEIVCIERDCVGVDFLKYRTFLWEGGLGTGKTEALVKMLKSKGIKSALFIYPRRSLAKSSSGRFGIDYYEDIEIISIEVDYDSDLQLSVVSNSLKRLGLTGNECFDAVVMDEIELNIQHIFGETFDKPRDLRPNTLQILRGLVKNAKHFIGMQAQITNLSFDFLRFCERDDPYFIRNTYQRFDNHPVTWYWNKEDGINQLYKYLDAGETCIVPSLSQTFLERLAKDLKKRYPNEQIVLVHSGNKGDPSVKAILENPNSARPLALLHSPVIGEGVSIESKWFKHCVGFCQTGDGVGTPDSFVQMMFRDRHLKDHAIFVEPQTYHNPTDYAEILEVELITRMNTKKTLEYLGDGKYKFSLKVDDAIIIDSADVLRAQTQASVNTGKNNAAAEVHSILSQQMGCDIKFVKPDEADKPKRDEIRANLKAAKERVKADNMATIVAAPAITPAKFENLCRANENTSADVAKVMRHLMEKSLAINLPSQNSSDLKEIFDFWDNGRGKDKLKLREIMALPQNLAVAYAEKLYVAGVPSLFLVTWLLLTWVLEVLVGRFDNDGRLEGGGELVGYKDFQGHTTWEWIKDKGNRDLANKTGLIYIRGDEPDASEIGGLIKRSGLPIKSKRVDVNTDQPEVSNTEICNTEVINHCDGIINHCDGKVDQKSVPGVLSNTLIYKNINHPPAQKIDPLSKRPSMYSIDAGTTKLIEPKATDSLGCLIFDWLVARLKDLVGLKVLDDWRIECKSDAAFGLADLCQGNEYQKVLANETAFNKAKLGAQIKDGVISPKGLRALLRKFGFNMVKTRTDKGSMSKGKAEKSERTQVRFYRLVPSQETEFLRENLARRAGKLYYAKAAQEWHDQKAQEIAEYGAPLIPDRSVSPATARFTIRFWILYLLHIVSNGRGGYKCDPDAVFRLEDIVNDMQDFVSRHKDVINQARLGAKVGNDGLTVKILSLWIKAMGIELSLKKIDACKLLINKEAKNANPDNTGGDPLLNGSKGEADHPNKTAGVENNVCKNNGLKTTKREMVRVFSVNPKCLQKVREIMDKDEHERENELMAQILDEVKTAPPINVQASIKEILDDADCQDLPSVLVRLDMLDGLSDDVYDRISGLLVEFSSGVAYDKGVFLDRVSELAQKYPVPKPWGTAVKVRNGRYRVFVDADRFNY
jgi:phage/plasmid primase-like uncharacterized protein